MIIFKDNLPRWNEDTKQYESMDSVLERINDFVREQGVRVINVETVVLPNIEETGQADSHTTGEDEWCQVIRLWYQE